MDLPTIINLPRGGGKTTALVYASAVDKVPILCFNTDHLRYIKKLAKKLGVNIPEPLICIRSELEHLGRFDFDKILIDDAEVVVPVLIKELIGAEIKGMTMSVSMVHPEQKAFSENQIDELVETIKLKSFKEAAEDIANYSRRKNLVFH